MKLLVFGKSGQVATELARRVPPGVSLVMLGREAVDLSNADLCRTAVQEAEVDAVINAAAYTAVDRAEEDEAQALAVNGVAPIAMAEAAAALDVPFVHISTDYVFDGSGERAWTPEDETGPLGAYGRTKLAGEEGIRAAGGMHAILRTSWVFSAHGGNFVKTMLRLSETRDRLTIVADQIGGPTPAADIADACLRMAQAMVDKTATGGTHHFAGAPNTSWAGFAREIFTQAGRAVEVVDISSEDFPTPAARPKNSRLDCRGLETEFGIARPDWRLGLAAVLEDLGAGHQ